MAVQAAENSVAAKLSIYESKDEHHKASPEMTAAFKKSLQEWMGIGYDSLGNIFDASVGSNYADQD